MWGNGAMSYITLAVNDSSAKTMTENLERVKKVLMTYLKAVKHLGNSPASCRGHGQVHDAFVGEEPSDRRQLFIGFQ